MWLCSVSTASPASTVTEPVIDVFPKSPLKVILGDTMVLHAEAASTTDRNQITWSHGNTTYSQHIREDPFCNPEVEVRVPHGCQCTKRLCNDMCCLLCCLQNCPTDTHPNATSLRRQRVRMYFFSRQVPLPGCQNFLLYRMESYLIVNRTNASDGGEYVFNITSRYSTGSESVERNMTAIISEYTFCAINCVPLSFHPHMHTRT